ncbi:type IV secretory system conjugative DNA transfer family protein (plasmid) [Campylobacter fetus]|uniref:Type IV secretory system conjugative DNA transfer family protein n=1 Tax=Campylobacter fetus TaxID=196 RepID=A0A974RL07_CAMFE|nr:type IV secretory system conjugative DNA transfer family protein [Campylobacter fetus]KAA3682730.1 type IV secretory system conjugative DNA transfer family protein [Campylobacter fetus subsp. venerealis]QMS59918.1 type IV secretory system conjugative DNA transfer family protein [Campylobacter fetus]
MKLNKAQAIFLAVIALVISYFLAGILCFALNDAFKMISKKWTADFTFVAIINSYPQIYPAVGLAMLLSFSIVFIIPFLPQQRSLHGKARFASAAEIRKLGLYGKDGIIIGKYNNKLLRFGGQQFVALGAPTRSGKGVGIVIPNLLDYKYSAVVQDIKQECFDFTSKYRQDKLGQEVFLFNPFDRRTHRYNPLAYINMQGTNSDGELTDFANILYPIKGDGSVTDYFNGKAQDLFIGLCYMCNDILTSKFGLAFIKRFNLECSFTLYGILSLSDGFTFTESGSGREVSGFEETYKTLCGLKIVSAKAQERINTFLNIKSDNERSSAKGSFISPLTQFRSDNMRLATSGNDFDFRDLRKKKMTIYVGITPDQLTNAKLILNIFWQQLILVNTKELPQTNKELKYPVMLLMDEFTASGYLPTYLKGISFIAGYGLRSVMIYQSNSQLETNQPDGYGREGAKTLLTNHACQIYYTPREQEDAEKISKMLGTMTVKNRSRNLGQGGGGSESDASRALMLPQELREMKFEDELITIDNGKPILCNKAFYYSDPYFMDKFKAISPTLKAVKGLPDKKQLENAIQNGETRIEIPTQSKEKLDTELQAIRDNTYAKLLELEGDEDFIDPSEFLPDDYEGEEND